MTYTNLRPILKKKVSAVSTRQFGPPLLNSYPLFGQALGLKSISNGNLSQNIIIPYTGKCTLQYYVAKLFNETGAMLETRWNGVRISLRTPAVNISVLEKFDVSAIEGSNQLLFM